MRAEHLRQLLLDDIADVLQGGVFAPHLLGELVPQLREVDLAQVHRQPLGVVLAGRLRPDGLVDDPVQLLEHLGHVGGVALLLQLLVDGLDVVVALGVGEGARLHQQRLEADEHLPRHDLEPALRLVRGVERVHGISQRLDPVKPWSRHGAVPDRTPSPCRCFSAASMACTRAATSSSMGATMPPPPPPSSSSPRAYCASASRRLLSMPL